MEENVLKFFDFSTIADNAEYKKVLDAMSGAVLTTMWTKLVPFFLGIALIRMVNIIWV